MFRWMPATRRIRLRWFSPSLERLVPNLERGLGPFDRDVGFETESGDCEAPATTPILQLGLAGGGFGFRFLETPTRFGEPGLNVARSLPDARDLLQTPLEPLGQPDDIESLDLAQSGLKAQRSQNRLDASQVGFIRFELGPARSELVARLHQLLDAARPFPHPCGRMWGGADAFPKLSPTLLGFRDQPCRARLRRPAPKHTGASVRRAAGFPVRARPDAPRPRSRRQPNDQPRY